MKQFERFMIFTWLVSLLIVLTLLFADWIDNVQF
jgi:hypothetical protein